MCRSTAAWAPKLDDRTMWGRRRSRAQATRPSAGIPSSAALPASRSISGTSRGGGRSCTPNIYTERKTQGQGVAVGLPRTVDILGIRHTVGTMPTYRLISLDDSVVFPHMQVTLPVDVGSESRVFLVPRHGTDYARVGVVAEVIERLQLPGGAKAVALRGLHRGVAGAARADRDGELRVEVEEHPDVIPPPSRTGALEQEYRAIVDEILEVRGDDGRMRAFVRSITDIGALA